MRHPYSSSLLASWLYSDRSEFFQGESSHRSISTKLFGDYLHFPGSWDEFHTRAADNQDNVHRWIAVIDHQQKSRRDWNEKTKSIEEQFQLTASPEISEMTCEMGRFHLRWSLMRIFKWVRRIPVWILINPFELQIRHSDRIDEEASSVFVSILHSLAIALLWFSSASNNSHSWNDNIFKQFLILKKHSSKVCFLYNASFLNYVAVWCVLWWVRAGLVRNVNRVTFQSHNISENKVSAKCSRLKIIT